MIIIDTENHLAALCYKGFKLCYFLDHFSEDCYCEAVQYECVERVRDEHGVLNIIQHRPDKFEFKISSREFLIEDRDPVDVIIDRFKAEVDFHLNHAKDPDPLNFIEDNFISVHTKRYLCPCCGTEFTTAEEGYTPKCENCGAKMELMR